MLHACPALKRFCGKVLTTKYLIKEFLLSQSPMAISGKNMRHCLCLSSFKNLKMDGWTINVFLHLSKTMDWRLTFRCVATVQTADHHPLLFRFDWHRIGKPLGPTSKIWNLHQVFFFRSHSSRRMTPPWPSLRSRAHQSRKIFLASKQKKMWFAMLRHIP